MKKLIFLFLVSLFIISNSYAIEDIKNHDLFGKNKNSLSLSDSVGIKYLKGESINNLSIQYSQPNIFLRLPGRVNLGGFLIQDTSTSDSADTVRMIGISQDVVFFSNRGISIGAGLGIYIKDKMTDRVNSRFTFGEKAFLDYRFTDAMSVEIFYRHFSNGDVAKPNRGYDFAGIAFLYYY